MLFMIQKLKQKNYFIIISILLVLIVVGIFFWNSSFRSSIEVSAAGENWLTSWTHRRAVTVTGTVASTNYQTKVDLNSVFYNEAGLISSWHMNEASGTSVADSSGNLNNGSVTGTTIVAGKYGSARSFSGTSKVQASVPLLTGAGDFTIEAWIYPTVSGGTDYIAGNYGTGNTGGLEFYKNSASNTISVYIGGQSLTSTAGINLNNWNHVVVTRTSGAGALYINGTPRGSGNINNSIGSSLNWAVGNGPDYTSESFDGNIDEVRVYSRALSAGEVTSHYSAAVNLDYSDIRFTSSDGSTELSYWMERDGIFWVKVPTISIGSNTIYMYYGNSAATTTSNGDNTFIFFDDFTGTTYTDKWTATGTWTEAGGTIVSPAATSLNYLRTNNAVLTGLTSFVVEGRTRALHSYGYGMRMGIRVGTTPACGGTQYEPVVAYTYGSYSPLFVINNATACNGVTQASPNVWYRGKIIINTAGTSYLYQYTDASALVASCSSATTSAGSGNYIAIFNADGKTEQDWIYIRVYASTEPTVAISSTEESPMILTSVSISTSDANICKLVGSNVVCKCGQSITFNSVASNASAIKLYICKDSACTNCTTGNTVDCWAYSSVGSTSNPSAVYDSTLDYADGCGLATNQYWSKVCSDTNCSAIQ